MELARGCGLSVWPGKAKEEQTSTVPAEGGRGQGGTILGVRVPGQYRPGPNGQGPGCPCLPRQRERSHCDVRSVDRGAESGAGPLAQAPAFPGRPLALSLSFTVPRYRWRARCCETVFWEERRPDEQNRGPRERPRGLRTAVAGEDGEPRGRGRPTQQDSISRKRCFTVG